jgi:hypothetical protein
MRRTHLAFIAALGLAACSNALDPADDGGGGGDDDGGGELPLCTVEARSYVGFGGGALERDREVAAAGADRLRLKPFVALAAEYARVLGLDAFNTGAYAATFGRPPARWFEEPAASANTLYAAYALAFEACSRHTAAGEPYAAAPTADAAEATCRELARRAWDREATDDEASTCATFAVNQTDPADAPRRRWAYTCAAVLSASGFLAY